MGEPISVLELAKNLLVLSGYDPENGDAGPGFEFTARRPGEKLHEALVEPIEVVEPSANPLIKKARASQPQVWDPTVALATLLPPAEAGDRQGVRAALAQVLGSDLLQEYPAEP